MLREPVSRAGDLSRYLTLGRREEEGPALREPGRITEQTPPGCCEEPVREH